MAVQQTEQAPEDKEQERAQRVEAQEKFSKEFVKGLDLPKDQSEPTPAKKETEAEEPAAAETEEEDTGSEAEEEAEDSKTESSEDESAEPDEDLVPKSRVQKRIDELTAEVKRLRAERESATQQTQAQKDADLEKLEAMTADELKALKRQVRTAQVKSSDDDAKLAQLLELEEKIDQVVIEAPQRLQKTQIDEFNKAVQESRPLLDNFEKVAPAIYDSAKQIYERTPELQRSPKGQRRAWELATEYYQSLSKASSSQTKQGNTRLKQEVNKLKKKTSLDAGQLKGNVNKDRVNKMYERARRGTLADKEAYVKEALVDPNVIPEEFRE